MQILGFSVVHRVFTYLHTREYMLHFPFSMLHAAYIRATHNIHFYLEERTNRRKLIFLRHICKKELKIQNRCLHIHTHYFVISCVAFIFHLSYFMRSFHISSWLFSCCYDLIWFDLIWFDLIWFDLIWFDLIWFDLIWFDLISSWTLHATLLHFA